MLKTTTYLCSQQKIIVLLVAAAQRPAELHAFDQGGHGFGVRLPKTVPASAWPVLFAAYARRSGVLAA